MARLQPHPERAHPTFPEDFASQEQASEQTAKRSRWRAAAARARAHRAHFLRLLGMALMIYGVIGVAATLYGYTLVRQAFASARDLGGRW
jgi:predicted lysophospholipase L1 biosynthesis ABC-type transport system permease subunit